ncbi:M23 family metallopeptidase [Streptomyces sp. BE147]|uniref:M23 family metallopeptidase n=1 Tax=Streptomyces sp. BE147 TaxID=3002524 RepID=UPI002E76A882|nr:M23 family metallopeptidase [Streptomyces sp. BE147]MEE1737075.1 M23 family metallopeptidase [Streptomyces sp. BE147]
MRKAPLIAVAVLLSPAIAVLALVLLLAGRAGGSDDNTATTAASQCIVNAATPKRGKTERPQIPLQPRGNQTQPNWNEEQTTNAAVITNVARTRNLKPRAAVIAVATAMQESTLHNLRHGDRDSQGLFQQRPSQGWGTVAQVTDPIHASNKFYDGLVEIPNWDTKDLARAAQGVQRSGIPDAYAKWETSAGRLVAKVWGADVISCEQPAGHGKAGKASGSWQAPVGTKSSHNYRAGGSIWSSGTHTGVDFPVPTGTELHAVGNATVIQAGWGGSYGNNIVLRMSDGTYTQYGHLSRVDVMPDQRIATGQVIGLTGATGNVTGPHLHFEARTGSAYGSDVDPVKYMRERGIAI